MREEIRLAGFGGQGIVLSGYILGKAAAIFSDKNATMTQSYGPEARGGACAANVVIEDEMVSHPGITSPDILVFMSQEAYNTYKGDIKKGVKVLYDEDLVKVDKGLKADFFSIPSLRIAEELGKKIVANIVMLGFFTAVTKMFKKTAMKEAILSSVPSHTKDLNERAFERGYQYGKELTEGKRKGRRKR